MFYELRDYQAIPGRLPALLDRFDKVVVGLWKKHGIQPLGFWTHAIGESTNVRLTYLLAWESLEQRQSRMASFLADPAWIEARDRTEANGPFVAKVSSSIMLPTAFSAMQ